MSYQAYTPIFIEAPIADPKHAVTAKWVDDRIASKVKLPVRAVAAANQTGVYASGAMTFTYSANGALAIDGVTLSAGDRVLLAGQTTGAENGIYVVTAAGNAGTAAELTRAEDFNASDEIFSGVHIGVSEGAQYADTVWALTTDAPITLDTTALVFVVAGQANGAGKFAADINGDNSTTVFNITHGLNSTDVITSLRNATTNSFVMADITVADANNISVTFGVTPPIGLNFRLVVIG